MITSMVSPHRCIPNAHSGVVSIRGRHYGICSCDLLMWLLKLLLLLLLLRLLVPRNHRSLVILWLRHNLRQYLCLLL